MWQCDQDQGLGGAELRAECGYQLYPHMTLQHYTIHDLNSFIAFIIEGYLNQ